MTELTAGARSALLFHFLFEASRLQLLPSALSHAVIALTALLENGKKNEQQTSEVSKIFSDEKEALGLSAIPSFDNQSLAHAAKIAFSQVVGVVTPRAAAERLGRFCEQLCHRTSDRKISGSFYTPGWLADEIAVMAVGAALRKGSRELRILDPAAGAGAFLVAVIEALAQFAGEGEEGNEIRRAVTHDNIFAIEMNPLAAEACRLSVWLSASRPDRLAVLPAFHIQIKDALDEFLSPASFDLVLGNPPWGVKLSQERTRNLTKLAPHLTGHRDSFLFFLELAQRITDDNGIIGMLLPEAFLWQIRYQKLRRKLLDNHRPVRLILLGDRIFSGVTAPCCALCLAGKKLAPARYDISDLRRIPRSELPPKIKSIGWSSPTEASLTIPHYSFLNPPEWLRDLLTCLQSKHHPLGDLKEIFVFHDVGINYPRAEIGRKILYEGPRQNERDHPVVRGRDFKALSEIGSSVWLRHDWRERVRSEDGVSVREAIYDITPKLLLRQTGDRPIATIDRRGVYFGRSVIAITARSKQDLFWLAGLLNSTPFAAIYRALTPETGRSFSQVKVNKLKIMPVPSVGKGSIAELAAQILEEADVTARLRLFAKLDDEVVRAYELTEMEALALTDMVRSAACAGTAKRGRRADTSSSRRK